MQLTRLAHLPAQTHRLLPRPRRAGAAAALAVTMPLVFALDRLSGGRAGIAFASGWHARDFVLAPDRHADRKAHTTAALEAVRRLWR